jgi:hypothetical protein
MPFLLFSLSGFNVEKIEDHLIAKVIKLFFILAIFYFLLKLGFPKDEIGKALLSRFGINM